MGLTDRDVLTDQLRKRRSNTMSEALNDLESLKIDRALAIRIVLSSEQMCMWCCCCVVELVLFPEHAGAGLLRQTSDLREVHHMKSCP